MLPGNKRHGQGSLRATAQHLVAELIGLKQLPVVNSTAQAGTSNGPDRAAEFVGVSAPVGGSQVQLAEQQRQASSAGQVQQQHAEQAANAGAVSPVPSCAHDQQPAVAAGTQSTAHDAED